MCGFMAQWGLVLLRNSIFFRARSCDVAKGARSRSNSGQKSRNYRFHRGETDSLVSNALAFLRLSLLRFAAEQRRSTEGESKPHSCSLRVPLSVFLARPTRHTRDSSKLEFPAKPLLI